MRIAIAGGTGVVGSYAADAAEAAGHDVVVLTRKSGVNVQTGEGLTAALDGADVIIDALNAVSPTGSVQIKASVSKAFFVATSRNLQEAGNRANIRHLVTLSIVGIDRVPEYGYYTAKLAQEDAVSRGPLPVTILRATQFHEFPAQIMHVTRRGPIAVVPRIKSQPVAARTVGEHLVRLATAQPGGTHELAGPDVHDIADLAKRIVKSRGMSLKVLAAPVPGKAGARMRSGALLATDATTIDGPTFDEWLVGDDAKRVEI
jgi:uncharacterized protein YbjT (DUF2867 family)